MSIMVNVSDRESAHPSNRQRRRRGFWGTLRLRHLGLIWLGSIALAIAFEISLHIHAWFSRLLVEMGISRISTSVVAEPWLLLSEMVLGGSILLLVQCLLVPCGWKLARTRFRPGSRLYLWTWVLASLCSGPLLLLPFVVLNSLFLLVWHKTLYMDMFELPIIVLYFLFGPPFIGARILKRRALRLYPHPCVKCGYNLRGNTSRRCPECGTEVGPT